VTLAEQMLARSVHGQQAAASASDRELYQRQIEATDWEIDKLVTSRELPQGADGRRNQNHERERLIKGAAQRVQRGGDNWLQLCSVGSRANQTG
jgi:hypothetical protein